MRKIFLLSIILSSSAIANAQVSTEPDSPKHDLSSFHTKGTWLVGAGATFLGLTAKGGVFAADQLWVGVEAERHRLFSKRLEAGLASRYYFGKGMMHGFVGAGAS